MTKAIKTAEALPPKPAAGPRRPKAAATDASINTAPPKTALPAHDLKPVVEVVPKVAARALKETEIRLVQKVDRAAADVEHSVQVYRGIERDGTERQQALVAAYGHFVHGAEEVQQHAWDIVQRSIGSALSIPREFAGCRSFTEIAEKQQDIVQGFFSIWVNASHTMLTASHRVFGRAIRPLELQLSGAEL